MVRKVNSKLQQFEVPHTFVFVHDLHLYHFPRLFVAKYLFPKRATFINSPKRFSKTVRSTELEITAG
jgi:hypothetical protein